MAEDISYQRLSLHDLSFDIQKRILSNQNPIAFRSLSRGMKECVDNFPESMIRLSRKGSLSSSMRFFSSFRGTMLIRCDYGLSGWLRSYLDSIGSRNEGANADHALQLELDEKNLDILKENLSRTLKSACSTKINSLSLSLRDSCNDLPESFSSLSSLEKYFDSVELRLEMTPRSPTTLLHVANHLAELPRSLSIIELAVRSARDQPAL